MVSQNYERYCRMEKRMEITIMDHQREKKMENEMENPELQTLNPYSPMAFSCSPVCRASAARGKSLWTSLQANAARFGFGV